MAGQFQRLGEFGRARLHLEVDGAPVEALAGDTLQVALLTAGRRLRDSEFGDGPRAGFCLMAACQDCLVWTVEGEPLRACSMNCAISSKCAASVAAASSVSSTRT